MEKPLVDFRINNNNCRECQAAYQREWRSINADKVRETKRQAYLKMRSDPDQDMKRKMRGKRYQFKKYGMTPEEFYLLVDKQEGRCAICLLVPSDRLCIDHEHQTGIVRGLLCRKCNVAIGLLQESTESLRRAISYLADG